MKELNRLFLLSIEEYERFKDNIPYINAWWWLRSPGSTSKYAADVYSDGSVDGYGLYVHLEGGAVRPAMVIEKDLDNVVGEKLFRFNFPFTIIGHSKKYTWLIADVPMAWDRFDDKINDYDESYIKNELLPKLEKDYLI